MPRAPSSRSITKNRHQPLENDILGPEEGSLIKAKTKSRPRRQNDDGDRDFDSRATKDILNLALLQQEEVEQEDGQLDTEQVASILDSALSARSRDEDPEADSDIEEDGLLLSEDLPFDMVR